MLTDTLPVDAGSVRPWHLGSMNDGLFIIDRPPSPAGTDVPPHADYGPGLVLNVAALTRQRAQAIVDAHNAALAPQIAGGGEVERAYAHVKECLHRAENRAQRAEDALDKVEDLIAEFGSEAPAIVGEYLGEHRHAIALATPPAAPAQDAGAPKIEGNCPRCQGNGEIITDWDRYLHSEPGDVGDEGTSECPDCNGTDAIEPTPPPASDKPAPAGDADDLVVPSVWVDQNTNLPLTVSGLHKLACSKGSDALGVCTVPLYSAATITRLTAERDARAAGLYVELARYKRLLDLEAQDHDAAAKRATAAETALAASRAEVERKDAAIDQALDDMGEDGLCVCFATRLMLRAALSQKGEG